MAAAVIGVKTEVIAKSAAAFTVAVEPSVGARLGPPPGALPPAVLEGAALRAVVSPALLAEPVTTIVARPFLLAGVGPRAARPAALADLRIMDHRARRQKKKRARLTAQPAPPIAERPVARDPSIKAGAPPRLPTKGAPTKERADGVILSPQRGRVAPRDGVVVRGKGDAGLPKAALPPGARAGGPAGLLVPALARPGMAAAKGVGAPAVGVDPL